MKNKVFNKKVLGILFLVMWIIYAFYAVFAVKTGTKKAFYERSRSELKQVVETKKLEFSSGLTSQLPMVLLMAKSPVIVDYMEDPKDKKGRNRAFAEFEVCRQSFLGKTVFWINENDMDFYSDGKFSYNVDPNDPSNYWYFMTVNDSKDYNFNINYNESLKSTQLWINAAVRNSKGRGIGIAGTGIPLDNFINAMYQGLDDEYTMYLFDKNEIITGAKDASLLGKNIKIKTYLPELENDAVILTDIGYKETSSGIYVFAPIESMNWMMVVYKPFSKEAFDENMTGPLVRVIIMGIILAFIMIMCVLVAPLFNLKRMQKTEKELASKLAAETHNLSTSAKENFATSQDQSAAVKEIVATMEDSNTLSENISAKIKDVSAIAMKNSVQVSDGVNALNQNVAQLREISEANQKTINGIKTLNMTIENIWEIVSIINNIADQTKIIAFNAELEASSAGEAGKNFHIVASEIRRLSDGIIDGTQEIKDRISEIQHSSDALILASESGTAKINEGCENAESLKTMFEAIKNGSEVTAESASAITSIIQQQAIASEQILITLKQIAAGVESFSLATEQISSSAQELQKATEELTE